MAIRNTAVAAASVVMAMGLAACSVSNTPAPPAPDAGTPVPSASVATNSADRSRTWTWSDNIRRTECTLEGAQLTLFDDGTYIFHSIVHSTGNNDKWQVHFTFLDRDQVLLQGLDTRTMEYQMDAPNQRYRWVSSRIGTNGMPADPSQARGSRLSDIETVNIMAGC